MKMPTMMDDRTGTGDVEIFVVIEKKTDKAVLCSDGTMQEWIPRSQIKKAVPGEGGFTITIPEWLAIKKGFV